MNEMNTLNTKLRTEPGCLIQAIWLLLVGWWAAGIAISVAWFLNATIIGMPAGLWILNNIPLILALQNPQQVVTNSAGQITAREPEQLPFIVRAVYFLLIGWWWSGVWLSVAYAICVTIIFMPIGLEMMRRTPFMTTLRRY